MNSLELLLRLKELDVPTFRTQDAAQLLGSTTSNASHHLRRLAGLGHIVNLGRGLWGLPSRISRWALPGLLSTPIPSYVSLYSALYVHGMIEQIPDVIYAVTAGRTARVKTPLGTVSFHHMNLAMVTGYTTNIDTGEVMASPEKALVDTLYLQSTRSSLFHTLPELEIPEGFDCSQAHQYVQLILHKAKRESTAARLQKILG